MFAYQTLPVFKIHCVPEKILVVYSNNFNKSSMYSYNNWSVDQIRVESSKMAIFDLFCSLYHPNLQLSHNYYISGFLLTSK